MRNAKLLVGISGLILFMGTGCSMVGHKADTTKASDEVIDAGMASAGAVKIKESQSTTIDAGVYREKEDYTDVATHGGKNGGVIPSEKFYTVDREKHAPVGKMLYVLTGDDPAHCILGKYVMMDGRKKLVVYSKSVVPTNYCIYQKQFSSEPEGFSIYVSDGGKCKPSFTVINIDDQKRKLASIEDVDNTVSMSYCVDNTFSFGQEIARHKSGY